MVWHVGGGQGESGGEKLGELTQGLGYPLREVSEVTVESITYRATDDAGDDSFTNVSNIGSIFDVNHTSIALNL